MALRTIVVRVLYLANAYRETDFVKTRILSLMNRPINKGVILKSLAIFIKAIYAVLNVYLRNLKVFYFTSYANYGI